MLEPAQATEPGKDSAEANKESVARRLLDARKRLIDRNLRNRLISTPLESSRTKTIKVIQDSSDRVYDVLVNQRQSMTFHPTNATEPIEEDVDTPLTSELLPQTDAYEGPTEERAKSPRRLQTTLEKDPLSKRLLSIYYESRDYEEEQGVNVLYLACGFLKWYEDDNSSVPRYSPLVLIPVELARQPGKGGAFVVRAREDEFVTNISLKVWLNEQFDIDLPEIPEETEWVPNDYCSLIRTAISSQKRWEVLIDEMLLGFFSFSKFLLWRDLDPVNWPEGSSLLEQPLIRKLLSGVQDRAERDPPLVPPEDSLDDHFTPRDLAYVLDADPSQTEAIQTALSGRDMVIQGPPGTGKSQTITNLIAAAVAKGKSVLFVAEKMAALEVVHRRLVNAGIPEICLELHSRKANKKSIHEQLKTSIDAQFTAPPEMEKVDRLERVQDFLNAHAKRINEPVQPWDFSPYELLGTMCLLQTDRIQPLKHPIPNAASMSRKTLQELETSLSDLCARLEISGFPSTNPWAMGFYSVLTPLQTTKVTTSLDTCLGLIVEIEAQLMYLESQIGDQVSEFTRGRKAELNSLTDIFSRARAFPKNCPVDWALEDTFFERADEIRTLLNHLTLLKERSDFIGSEINAIWRSIDLDSLHFRLKTHGGRLLSIFSPVYRQSKRELNALCKNAAPKSFAESIGLLENLMQCAVSEKYVESLDEPLRKLHDPQRKGENIDTSGLEALCGWHAQTEGISLSHYRIATQIADRSDLLQIGEALTINLSRLYSNIEVLQVDLQINESFFQGINISSLKEYVELLKRNIHSVNQWPPTREKLQELRSQLGEELYELIWRGRLPKDDICDTVVMSIFEEIWGKVVEKDPNLSTIDSVTLNNFVNEFRELDSKRASIAADEIRHTFRRTLPRGNAGAMGLIRQELLKKSRHMSLRKLMGSCGDAIQKLKPVFLMSPLSVAQFLTPGKMVFDMLVIDEASQIRPEDALGAVARAKQVVIVGDQQQLPPTNFFNRLTSDDEETDEDMDAFSVTDMESILSLADLALPNQSMLTWHYRSLHPGLIAVSNKHFYRNELKLPPSTLMHSYADGMGVSMIKSPDNSYERGGPRGGTNLLEAKMIAEEVISFARKYPDKSLGVAAFSVKQRDLIRELVEIQFAKSPEVREFFSDSRVEPFFVKNLESIQGDERDVIFISVGYGRSSDGILRKSFGPLALAGGERRLNVLISRAKERVTVFSSITADDFTSEPGKVGLNAFREFLQYAEKGFFDVAEETERDFDSDFEESVAVFLRNNGYEAKPQVGMSGFFIDLGVVHPKNSASFLCGIECDGATYHSSKSARERDRLRQSVLESRGWRIYRIWSTDWFYRRRNEEERLLDALHNMTLGGYAPASSMTTLDEPAAGVHEVGSVAAPTPRQSTKHIEPFFTTYVEHSEVRRTDLPLHEVPKTQIDSVTRRILEVEGPIHELEVARRLAKIYGFARTGSRIQEVAKKSLMRQGAVRDGEFWWLSNAKILVRNRSLVSSKTLLSAALLPPIEILEAAKHIVSENVRVSGAELSQAVAKAFGFQRVESDLRTTILGVIGTAVGTIFVVDSADSYSLRE